ncbi:MAG TPA: hypothetical protein VFD15_06400 [Clostridia bacterium]|nr:hypothetical protein [Clostridia bacterium]
MTINFEKNGVQFEVSRKGRQIEIAAKGITAEAKVYYYRTKDTWVYEVNSRDFNKALGMKGGRLLVGHESAQGLWETMKLEQETKEKKEINDIKTGKTKITVHYKDGNILTGYSVFGHEAELLVEIGAARDVAGWGTCVNDDLVKALGETFTYAEAYEFMLPEIEARAQKAAEKKAAEDAKFAKAKATGKPVILYEFSVDCNDPNEDCDLDIITGYAMPDGTTKETRRHTW